MPLVLPLPLLLLPLPSDCPGITGLPCSSPRLNLTILGVKAAAGAGTGAGTGAETGAGAAVLSHCARS